MDQGFRFLCRAEARRLLLLMGATLALVVVAQHYEFPSSRVLLSLFPTDNPTSFQSRESSTNSRIESNTTVSNTSNLIYTASTVHEEMNSGEASNVKRDEGNESKEKEMSIDKSNVTENNSAGNTSDDYTDKNTSSILEKGKTSVDGYAAGKAMAPATPFMERAKRGGSLDSDPVLSPNAAPPINELSESAIENGTKSSSPMISVNSSSSSVRKGVATTLNIDQNSGSVPSKHSVSGSGSSASNLPVVNTTKYKKAPSIVFSMSQMNALLQQSRASSHAMRPRWPSEADQELLFVKSQIQGAPEAKNDDKLYAPIYRNVSMFKRSYELMEEMLKVYIYQDGEKPIFHQQILDGIYASEGWFMKHMEAHEKFVTKDPKKAHLFYFPFSSRLLELTLYVRHSHKRSNLIEYMRGYVDMIAARYPFWNRTGGADHFLAACHDWAPAETRGPMLNCIRALCNADIDVGFSIGKDVSLPETYVRSAQNPNKNLEGNPPSQRPILAFFAGNLHGYVRPILLEYWENKDPDMKIFGPLPHVKGNKNYIELMKTSKYCICPKGHEVNSPRIVEAFFFECVPVIISDNYVPPFFEVLDWESFAVFVLERDIPNLKNILASIPEEKYVEMHKRVKMVQQHFLWHTQPVKYDLFHMILHSVWYNRVFLMRPA